MEDTGTLARPYAVAAFQQAQDEGKVGEWSDMLSLLALIGADATVKGLVANPKADKEQLASLILDVAGDKLSETGRNFVRLVLENGRLGLLDDIARQFEAERAKTEGRRQIKVVSAYKLSAKQSKDLAAKMAARLGAEVDMTVELDKSLIGGVIIHAGDMVIDASLRGRLAQLEQSVT